MEQLTVGQEEYLQMLVNMYDSGRDVSKFIFDVASGVDGTENDYMMLAELGKLGMLLWEKTADGVSTGTLTSRGRDYFRDIERAKAEAERTRKADRKTALIAGMAGAAVSAILSGLLSIATRLFS